MAANTDKALKVGIAGSATTLAGAGHTSGGTTITVTSTTNWPTDTAVAFAIDRVTLVDGVEVQTAGSYTEWVGTVATGTSIDNMTLSTDSPNADQDYPAGSLTRVYIPVTATATNRLVDHVTAEHNQDGTHKFTQVLDANGNESLKLGSTASAVNEVTLTNAATGNSPTITATGSDTNIDLTLAGKGTGTVVVPDDAITAAKLANGLVYKRQGGSATHWYTAGTTNYDVDAENVKIQVGSFDAPGSNANHNVVFPEAFTYTPIVVATPQGASGLYPDWYVVANTNTGFTFREGSNVGTFQWIAIGV